MSGHHLHAVYFVVVNASGSLLANFGSNGSLANCSFVPNQHPHSNHHEDAGEACENHSQCIGNEDRGEHGDERERGNDQP